MSTVSVNLRMDSEIKNQLEDFCKDVGLSMSAVFTIYAKKIIAENKIPFEITGSKPNKETLNAFEEAKDIVAHPEKYKKYSSAQEMIEEVLGNV